MFSFCLCDVSYWISVNLRVNTVQKVKRKNMQPEYVGRFTAGLCKMRMRTADADGGRRTADGTVIKRK